MHLTFIKNNFGLEKEYRLKSSLEIKNLFQARRVVIKPFVIFHRENLCGYPRIVVCLTRKTGNSVARNRIKRKIKEWFRIHKSKLIHHDFLFYSNFNLSESNSKSFWQDLEGKLLQTLS